MHLCSNLNKHFYLTISFCLVFVDWDSDMASLLLLLHLLPPTAGRKRVKISSSDAEKKLVHFHKVVSRFDTISLDHSMPT